MSILQAFDLRLCVHPFKQLLIIIQVMMNSRGQITVSVIHEKLKGEQQMGHFR